MADKTQFLRSSMLNRDCPVGSFVDTITAAAISGSAANGDRIQLMTVTRDMRLFDAYLGHSASLGAAATLKLQRDRAGVYTDITGATTAAGASVVNSTAIGPMDLLVGDIITCLVGGGNILAAATITCDLQLAGK